MRSLSIVQVCIHLPYICQTVNYNNFPGALNGLGLLLCVNYRGFYTVCFVHWRRINGPRQYAMTAKVFYRSWESIESRWYGNLSSLVAPSSGPKFLHFHAVFRKNWPNKRLAPLSGVRASSREMLDPPLTNTLAFNFCGIFLTYSWRHYQLCPVKMLTTRSSPSKLTSHGHPRKPNLNKGGSHKYLIRQVLLHVFGFDFFL